MLEKTGTIHPTTAPAYRNAILAALPSGEIALLRPHMTRSSLVNGQVLHEAGQQIDQVYFFEQGFASLVAIADDSISAVEVGIVGRDGMLGLPIVLNPAALSFNRSMVQMPGLAHRMTAAGLVGCLEAAPVLAGLLRRSLEVYIAQISQTAACNSCHGLAERCARWLLIAHDRADGDELRLTQEFLSMMLAVRRAGVTVAMQSLQTAGLVQSGRGRILVCDRAGLEEAACGRYGRVRAFGAAVAEGYGAADAAGAAQGLPAERAGTPARA